MGRPDGEQRGSGPGQYVAAALEVSAHPGQGPGVISVGGPAPTSIRRLGLERLWDLGELVSMRPLTLARLLCHTERQPQPEAWTGSLCKQDFHVLTPGSNPQKPDVSDSVGATSLGSEAKSCKGWSRPQRPRSSAVQQPPPGAWKARRPHFLTAAPAPGLQAVEKTAFKLRQPRF